jgi:hypothetical protein
MHLRRRCKRRIGAHPPISAFSKTEVFEKIICVGFSIDSSSRLNFLHLSTAPECGLERATTAPRRRRSDGADYHLRPPPLLLCGRLTSLGIELGALAVFGAGALFFCLLALS